MTMARTWKQCEDMLRRMAESMGLMVISVPANGKRPATWHVAQRRDGSVFRLTVRYFSPKELLGKMLNYYQAFNVYGRVVDNPFFEMSPEEAELRLAVMGA